MSIYRRLFVYLLLVIPLVLGLSVTLSTAQSEVRRGVSMVSDVDLERSRITIDDEVYRVGESCVIQRFDGVPMTLGQIRVPRRRANELIAIHEVDFIRFEAVQRGGRWYMERMTILEEPVQ